MHTRRFERVALAMFFQAACIVFFGAGLTIERAHAQGTNTALRAQNSKSQAEVWIAAPQCHHRPLIRRVHTLCLNRPRPPSRRQVRDRYLDQLRALALIELHDEVRSG